MACVLNLNHQPGACDRCGDHCIKNTEFLAGLPEEKMLKVVKKSRVIRVEKEEALFEEGEKVDGIFIIRDGRVKLCTFDADGREQIITIFSTGDTIWEGILMEDSVYPYHAIAMGKVEYCKVFKADLEEAMTDPVIALRVIALLSEKLHNANERNMLLAVSNPKARLAGLLLLRSRHAGSSTIKLTLEDMAGSINLRPETISRKIRELDREGVIEKTGQSTVKIVQRKALESIFHERNN